MVKIKGAVVIDTVHCKGCAVCVDNCPTGAIGMSAEVNDKGYAFCSVIDADKCVGCASCAVVCPDSCITVYKQKFTE